MNLRATLGLPRRRAWMHQINWQLGGHDSPKVQAASNPASKPNGLPLTEWRRHTVPRVTNLAQLPSSPVPSIQTSYRRSSPTPRHFANMTQTAIFDILTTDAAELQALQVAGTLTSVDLVQASFDQVDKFNSRGPKLNAIINTTPRRVALGIAKNLDEERSQGRVRGPLHGIPMTVKDSIMTGPKFELPTTVGSIALKSAMARRNAPIVDMVRQVAV